ncbi:MAG: MarR family transcriptional regulator [Lachnospira sp.]
MGKLDSIEFLKIRILVSLLKMSPENCNVTNLSKTLGVEKYTVSRVFTALEKDGYLNRTDSRHPRLLKSWVNRRRVNTRSGWTLQQII